MFHVHGFALNAEAFLPTSLGESHGSVVGGIVIEPSVPPNDNPVSVGGNDVKGTRELLLNGEADVGQWAEVTPGENVSGPVACFQDSIASLAKGVG